jgi:hypothetical protein
MMIGGDMEPFTARSVTSRWAPLVSLLAFALSIPTAHGDEPATRPADDELRSMIARLGAEKPVTRDAAKTDLLGLPGESLEDIRRLVTTGNPPVPAVATGLHDVVIHLFLKRQGYRVASPVKGQPVEFVAGLPQLANDPNETDEPGRLGYTINEVLPGFPAYQYLRPGDLVIGIYVIPLMNSLGEPNTETHSLIQFRQGVQQVLARNKPPEIPKLTMQLIRGGRSMRITVPMALKPADIDTDPVSATDPDPRATWTAFAAARALQAERYWHTQFAVPLKLAGE